jgi:hypothetical protein
MELEYGENTINIIRSLHARISSDPDISSERLHEFRSVTEKLIAEYTAASSPTTGEDAGPGAIGVSDQG